jgi:hypothetical protein
MHTHVDPERLDLTFEDTVDPAVDAGRDVHVVVVVDLDRIQHDPSCRLASEGSQARTYGGQASKK